MNNMKNAQNRAITRCYQQGIAVSRREFENKVREYNNYEMPISTRVMTIARGWDSKFFEFLKERKI